MSASEQRPPRATATGNDEFLLTPGPLTTSLATKQAMLRDWGSRDGQFIELNARIRRELIRIAGGTDAHDCVPVQGSGTFAIEATLGTFVPRDGKLLVLVNGAYGERMLKIARYAGREVVSLKTAEDVPVSAHALDEMLTSDSAITHIAVVHCETTSGILNPIAEVAEVVRRHNRRLIVDAMSAFGAIPINISELDCDAIVASSNKCLEGVPGVGYAVVKTSALEQCEGNAHALSLDLHDQYKAMQGNGQWRFTPPTHVLAAFDQAIREFVDAGGVQGRGGRYTSNCRILVEGMRELGFKTLLPDELQAPIIITFHMPADPAFVFEDFYDRLAARGYVIYPGKLTVAPSFRIGCIGQMYNEDLHDALTVIKDVLADMGVTQCGPSSETRIAS